MKIRKIKNNILKFSQKINLKINSKIFLKISRFNLTLVAINALSHYLVFIQNFVYLLNFWKISFLKRLELLEQKLNEVIDTNSKESKEVEISNKCRIFYFSTIVFLFSAKQGHKLAIGTDGQTCRKWPTALYKHQPKAATDRLRLGPVQLKK